MSPASLILTLAIVSGQLFKIPFGNGGITILDVVVAFLCLGGLFKLKFKLKKPPLFIVGAIGFILIATLSLILTPLRLNLLEYITSFLYTVRFAVYILLGWIILSGAFAGLRRHIPHMLIFSGLGLAVLGLLQFIFLPDLGFLAKEGWDPHYFRTVSTFLDPNFLGCYFVLTLLLLTSLLRSKTVSTPGVLLMFAIIYLALLTTFSRGSYLAFFIGFLMLSFLLRSTKLGIFTIILFFGLLFGFSVYQKSVAQPRGIDRTQSAEFRLSTWQQGGVLFQTHPCLGVGFNAYRYALKQYNLGDEKFLSSRGSSTNDSSLLFVAATTGILGFASLLFFLSSMIWKNTYNFILTAGLSGLIIQSFFANTLFYPSILIWLVLVFAMPTNKH